jgi:hypothetical protein
MPRSGYVEQSTPAVDSDEIFCSVCALLRDPLVNEDMELPPKYAAVDTEVGRI